jgi:hypothetical protein
VSAKNNILRVPVIRILDGPELEPEVLPQVLREINERQWNGVRQVLVEAKYKAEALLRNDEVMNSTGKVTYYQGWVAYADYVIGSLEGIREQVPARQAGPEPGPE